MSRIQSTVIEQTNATGRVSYWQGIDNQSLADRNGISLADYIHAMYGLIRQAKSQRVLLIGCGGGTLATMLLRARVVVSIVDIDAASFEIARTYFAMPAGIDCHIEDGVSFLRRSAERYSAIVLDAYCSGGIPAPFLRSSFFKLAKSRLSTRGGLFLINVLARDDNDRRPDEIARRMQGVWRRVRILDADGYVHRNVVLLAGAVGALHPPRLHVRPCSNARTIARNLRELSFRRLRT